MNVYQILITGGYEEPTLFPFMDEAEARAEFERWGDDISREYTVYLHKIIVTDGVPNIIEIASTYKDENEG